MEVRAQGGRVAVGYESRCEAHERLHARIGADTRPTRHVEVVGLENRRTTRHRSVGVATATDIVEDVVDNLVGRGPEVEEYYCFVQYMVPSVVLSV